ncbi:MAG: NUDIX hydrolase [Gordonia sp. (in: high G+C Gram-positive bacteria)]
MADTPIDATPAPPRDAASVVLVRDGAAGIEVFLQRRVTQMAFAGGMTVFPGGGVDARDFDADLAWTGPDVGWWAAQFATTTQRARALVCAAVRETFEECGVLLASREDGSFPAPTSLRADRDRLVAKTISFADVVRARELTLRADLLRPLAHWITPKNEKRRYDTRFFLAAVPPGQVPDAHTSEADVARWSGAGEALRAWSQGAVFLLPPTWAQLTEVARFGTVDELLAAPHPIEPIEPAGSGESGAAGLSFAHADEYYAGLGANQGLGTTR